MDGATPRKNTLSYTKFAIEKSGDDYWNEKLVLMIRNFRENNYTEGLIKVIADIGEGLARVGHAGGGARGADADGHPARLARVGEVVHFSGHGGYFVAHAAVDLLGPRKQTRQLCAEAVAEEVERPLRLRGTGVLETLRSSPGFLPRFSRTFQVFVGAQNLTNKVYFVQTNPSTVGTPRLVTGGVRIRFAGR